MNASPRSAGAAGAALRARDLPGVQAALRVPRRAPEIGGDWALVVFCTFGAPPALVLAGLLHAGSTPVLFWLAACASFFSGLTLSLRLRPLPPRRVFDAGHLAADAFARSERLDPELPGLAPGVSRAELLERLAKLREQGELSGREYDRAVARLLPG